MIKQKLKAWENLLLSLIGKKKKIVKVKILPVLLYNLQHSSIWVSIAFFKQFNSLISSYLWEYCPQ